MTRDSTEVLPPCSHSETTKTKDIYLTLRRRSQKGSSSFSFTMCIWMLRGNTFQVLFCWAYDTTSVPRHKRRRRRRRPRRRREYTRGPRISK